MPITGKVIVNPESKFDAWANLSEFEEDQEVWKVDKVTKHSLGAKYHGGRIWYKTRTPLGRVRSISKPQAEATFAAIEEPNRQYRIFGRNL